jgi:phosphoribosylformylglycinamidine synthase
MNTTDELDAYFERVPEHVLTVVDQAASAPFSEPIPTHWPRFLRNRSEQYEARLGLLQVMESPSLFLHGMAGSRLPVAVAHGEGRAQFDGTDAAESARIALRYVGDAGGGEVAYPANPNGSQHAVAGLTSDDGRVTILMPHPERTLRAANYSWAPRDWSGDSPWLRMFRNARAWVG